MTGQLPISELIYISAASAPMKPGDLASLLLKARANNASLGVSGMLIHYQGSFFQILEGHADVVEHLFTRIGRDKRHTRVAVLSRSQVAERSFGDWRMGFVEGASADLKNLVGFTDFLRKGFESQELANNPGRAKDLLLAFRAGRFRQAVDV